MKHMAWFYHRAIFLNTKDAGFNTTLVPQFKILLVKCLMKPMLTLSFYGMFCVSLSRVTRNPRWPYLLYVFLSGVKLVPQHVGASGSVRHDKSAYYLPCSDIVLVCYFNLQPDCPLELPLRCSDRHFGWPRGRCFVKMSSYNAMMPCPQGCFFWR